VVQNSLALSARFWLARKWWLSGGVAMSTVNNFVGQESFSDTDGASYTAAGGYEVFGGERYAIEATVRLTASSYPNSDMTRTSLAFLLGFTRY
jgi:hypothetical protein